MHLLPLAGSCRLPACIYSDNHTCHDSPLSVCTNCLCCIPANRLCFVAAMQVVVVQPCIALSLRPTVGRFLHCQICADSLGIDDLSISEYQKFKERLAGAGSLHAHAE